METFINYLTGLGIPFEVQNGRLIVKGSIDLRDSAVSVPDNTTIEGCYTVNAYATSLPLGLEVKYLNACDCSLIHVPSDIKVKEMLCLAFNEKLKDLEINIEGRVDISFTGITNKSRIKAKEVIFNG